MLSTSPNRIACPLNRKRTHSLAWLCAGLLFWAGSAMPARADTGEHLNMEQTISDQLRHEHWQAAQRRQGKNPKQGSGSTQAILPQLGVDPASGFIIGAKYANRDLGPGHLLLDAGGYYATKGEQQYKVTLLDPHFIQNRFIGLMQLIYRNKPSKEFFGLGNNDVGSHQLSTNEVQRVSALFKFGWRATPDLVFTAGLGFEHVGVGRGSRHNDNPYTEDRFPRLTGLDGGYVSPVSISAVYNTRDDVTRPTRGFNIIAQAQHVGPELGNDYTYGRYILDVSYLFPLFIKRQVIALRLAGEYLSGGSREVPFFNMASLGGVDNLRGFYPDRFLGRGYVLANVEYRLKLADFNFYNIYKRVRIDGVLFGGAGRVFESKHQLRQDYGIEDLGKVPSSTSGAIRLSYGAGVRIALNEALVARIDVGFSDDETGQIYLTFGQAF